MRRIMIKFATPTRDAQTAKQVWTKIFQLTTSY